MADTEKPRIDPAEVQPGVAVQRRPFGRSCTVAKVNADRSKVLVRDGHTSVWLNMGTLLTDWALSAKAGDGGPTAARGERHE